MNRLLLALGMLTLLGVAAFESLSDVRFRSVTLALLALCAVKVLIAHKKRQQEAQETDPGPVQ